MANTNCVLLKKKDVEDVISKWLSQEHDEATNNYVAQQVPGFDASWDTEKKIKSLFQYFNALISSYNKTKGTVVIPDMDTLSVIINDDMRTHMDDKKSKEKVGPVYIGGELSTADEQITGVLTNEISVKSRSADCNVLADIVENQLRIQLRDVGIDMDKSEDRKKFAAFIKLFRNSNYNCTTEDLFNIVLASCSIKDGATHLSEANLKKALSGDRNALSVVHNMVEGFRRERAQLSGLEQKVMDAILSIYSKQHKGLWSALTDIQDREIRAANGSSRTEKALASSLRALRNKTENEAVDITDYNIPFNPEHELPLSVDRTLLDRIEDILKNMAEDRGYTEDNYEGNPYNGVADYLDQLLGGTTTIQSPLVLLKVVSALAVSRTTWHKQNGEFTFGEDGKLRDFLLTGSKGEIDVTDYYSGEDYTTKTAITRDESGQYDYGLYRDDVHNILRLAYRQALFNGGVSTDASLMLDALAKTSGQELTAKDEVFYPEIIRVLNDLRDEVIADKFEEDYYNQQHENVVDNYAELTADERLYRASTITGANIAYDSKKLRARTNAICYGIISSAERQRYTEVSLSDKKIKKLEAKNAELEAEKEGLLSGVPTEEDTERINAINEELKSNNKEIRKLRKYINNLRDDTQFLRAVLKKKAGSVISVAFNEITRISPYKNEDGEIVETQANFDYRKEEVKMMQGLRPELVCRALAQLEQITGIHIIMNSSLSYEVYEPEQEEANENDEEGAKKDSSDSLDYRDDEDPFAHLSQNVRTNLAMIPVLDWNNEPILDDIGQVQYHDPKEIMASLLDMMDGWIAEAGDFYTLIPREQLDDTVKKYPPLLNGNGVQTDGELRTEYEAFPFGKPDFTILSKNSGKYPWVQQLINRLTENFMERSTVAENNNPINMGIITRDLYCELGHVFMKRAMLKGNSFFETNTLAAVDSAKRSQQRNYDNRIKLEDTMIYTGTGQLDKANVEYLLEALNNLPTTDEMRNGLLDVDVDDIYKSTLNKPTSTAVGRYAYTLTQALRSMGFEVEYVDIASALLDLENESTRTRMYSITTLVKDLLNALNNRELNNPEDDNIYHGEFSRWRRLWEAAGYFVNKNNYQVSTTENGRTRYNYLHPNTITKIFNILTYGYRGLMYGDEESRKRVLEDRRKKIDKMFRGLNGFYDESTDQYINPIIRDLYDGKDISNEKDIKKAGSNIRAVGELVQVSSKDDKELSQMTPGDQLATMVGAANAHNRSESGLVRMPVMADAPIMQFVSVRYSEDPIDEMSNYVRMDYERIKARRAEKVKFAMIYAASKGLISHKHKTYYDYVAGVWLPMSKSSDWKIYEACRKFDELSEQEQRVALQQVQNKYPGFDLYYDDYKRYKDWVPHTSYFTHEMKYGWIREIGSEKAAFNEVVDSVLKNIPIPEEFSESAATQREYLKSVREAYNKYARQMNGKSFTMEEFIDTIERLEPGITYTDTLDDIIRAYTDIVLKRKFAEEMKSKDFREPMSAHHELATLNRIEMSLQGRPDFDGERWTVREQRIEEDGKEKTIFSLIRDDESYSYALSDAEARYYQERTSGYARYEENAMNRSFTEDITVKDPITWYRDSGTRGSVVNGKDKSYSRKAIVEFRPPFVNQGELLSIMKKKDSNAKFEDVPAEVERVWYQTYLASTAVLQMMGMDPSMFKSDEELTKRLKGIYSNGLRLDSNAPTGYTTEYFITIADDETSISNSFADIVAAFKDMVDKGMDKDEAMAKCKAYLNINGSDAQGLLNLIGYRQKASMAGSSYWTPQMEQLYYQIISGERKLSDFDKNVTMNTIKQVGMAPSREVNPDGTVTLRCQFIKNSEALMTSNYEQLGTPRSAQLIALDTFISKGTFTDPKTGKEVRITSIQRPSGVKTGTKGVIDTRYIPRRITEGLIPLLTNMPRSASEQKQFIDSFIDRWSDQVDNVMDLTPGLVRSFYQFLQSAMPNNKNEEYLSFEDIDNYVHKALESITKDRFDDKISASSAEKQINALIALRNFMLPVKATEETVADLREELHQKVANPDGTINDQYVNSIDVQFQAMQVRQSNHYFDGKSHLGSQASYLMTTGLKKDELYPVEVNGEVREKYGSEIYERFYECLGARLLHGVQKATGMFDDIHELKKYMWQIVQNNPAYGPEVLKALNIIEGTEKFETPLSSVAIIYKVSDILTSIIRNNTIRKPVNGGAAVIEEDSMYDENLRIEYENGKPVGVQCLISPSSYPMLKHCIVKKKINGKTVDTIDLERLKGTGLEKMIGYRIPTEEYHSMLPLIIKGPLPPECGAKIVVAKEITTLTGGDNDVDKLFLMIKHINEDLFKKKGVLEPVKYDWDKPILEQGDAAAENMMIDLFNAVLTAEQNQARWLAPQNPDKFKPVAARIAYLKLPMEKKMKKRRSDNMIVYEPDNEHWNDPNYYVMPSTQELFGFAENRAKVEDHMKQFNKHSVQSIGGMVHAHRQHNLAKIGVAVGADNMSGYAKVRSGLDYTGESMRFKTEKTSGLKGGIRIDGIDLDEYCPSTDVNGHSVMENCSDLSAAFVDSGKSDALTNIGVNLNNASFAGFLLKCGFSLDMMAYAIAILDKYPNFSSRYDSIYRQITKEGATYEKADKRDFGNLTMAAFENLLDNNNMLSVEKLSDENNLEALSVFHCLRFFQRVHDNMRNYERTLKFNSAKHALSNEPASAVWSQLLVDRVEKDREKLLVDVPESMIVRNGVSYPEITDGAIETEDGRKVTIGVPLPQMYYTCGIESFNAVMKDRLFYAHPAFTALVKSFTPLIEKLPKDKGIKFIKQLHDEFSVFYLSRMKMVNERKDIHGVRRAEDFTDVRDYYRYQFPKEMEKVLKDKTLRDKYAIFRVMTVKDGKLIIDDDRKNELTKTDINASLARMANSSVKREKEMARDIWLCAFFTDGLRFSYGALSNTFEPSFLANKMFEEYNVSVEAMCLDESVTGKDLSNFAVQFVRNNYKQYQFGTLFRTKTNIAKNDEGLYESQEPNEPIELADDEITVDDAQKLEEWLTDKETQNMLMLEGEEPLLTKNGKIRKEVPTAIIDKVKTMEPGTFFRVQVSFSIYDQNLYQVRENEDGIRYVVKLQDFLGDKWYNRDMDILEQADKDCMVDEKGKTAWKSKVLKDSVRKKSEEQKRFFTKGLSDKQLRHNQKVQDAANGSDELYVEGADFMFNSSEDLFMREDIENMDLSEVDMNEPTNVPDFSDRKKQTKKWRRGDKTVEISESFFDNLKNYGEDEYDPDAEFDNEEEDFSASLMAALDVEERTPEEIAVARRQLLEDSDALGVFNTYDKALQAATRANSMSSEFVATVEERDGGYRVDLHDASNTEMAERWREQYGISVLTGDDGVNLIMDSIGNPSEPFIEPDDDYEYEEYKQLVRELIELIRFSKSGRRLQTWPTISAMTANFLVYKLKGTPQLQRLSDDIKAVLRNATNASEFVRSIAPGSSATIIMSVVQNCFESGSDIPDVTIEDIMVNMLTNPYAALQKLSTNSEFGYISRQFKSLLLGVVRTEMTELPDNAADELERMLNESEFVQPTVTVQQQRAAQRGAVEAEEIFNEITELQRILERAQLAEERRYKMLLESKFDVTTAGDRMRMLDAALDGILGSGDGVPNLTGVLNYLNHLKSEYAMMSSQLHDIGVGATTGSRSDDMDRLARMRIALRAHEEMLEALTNLVEMDEFRRKMASEDVNSQELASIRSLVNATGRLHINMCNRFADIAATSFIEFVKDFVDENDTIQLPGAGEVTWKQLFETYDGDITWVDKWLRSMGDTNDPIGQLYDRVVKKQKDRIRETAISDQQNEIKGLNGFILAHKINDFEFMFEHDEDGHKTGYYVTKVNNGRFQKTLKEQERIRNEVHNDPSASDEEKRAADNAYSAWVAKYANEDASGHLSPKEEVREGSHKTYPWINHEWDAIQADPVKKEFMERFMAIKRRYDSRLGEHTAGARAIQRRMSSEQRFRANFTLSPTQFFNNMKQKLAEDYLVREDDYLEAGERSTVLDFDGTERMVMPAPFVRMLKNPDELSTDPIGCLVAYSYASANYEGMRAIVNPLEAGFDALVAGRVQYDEQNGRMTVEKFRSGRKEKAKVKESKFLQKLRSFLDTQLYMRYIADKDDTFTIMGTEFRKSKVVNAFLRMSAIAQLGFNWLVDIANLANGLAQTNIEAAARRYFSGTTLRKADAEYFKAMKDFLPDLNRPLKESKLALVSEKLDIMQNFDVKIYNNRRNSLLAKLFNTQIAFMGTSCGNHWLYHRVAIARMLSTKVLIPGEGGATVETNLWDAFTTAETETGGKIAVLPEGATLEDGTVITNEWLHNFGRETDKLNQGLVGIYNRDDMVMAQKISWAKLFISFRKHIVPLMDKRWRKKHINEFGKEEEGYMRTFGSVLLALRDAKFNIPAVWDELSEEDKAAVRMAMTDILQFAALCILASLPFFGGDDDDDKDGAEARLKKICAFLIARERHELGSMLPTLYAPKEAINIISQPAMGTTQLEDIYNFCNTAFTPWTWNERVKAGPFQGQTEIEMRFRKLPIPVLSYYRNIDKSMNGINNSTWFYNRGYVGNMHGSKI